MLATAAVRHFKFGARQLPTDSVACLVFAALISRLYSDPLALVGADSLLPAALRASPEVIPGRLAHVSREIDAAPSHGGGRDAILAALAAHCDTLLEDWCMRHPREKNPVVCKYQKRAGQCVTLAQTIRYCAPTLRTAHERLQQAQAALQWQP